MKCKNCIWAEKANPNNSDFFNCHFNPPTVNTPDTIGLHADRWPVVMADDFCSKFERETK